MWGTKKKRGKGQKSRKQQCKATIKVTISAKNMKQKLGENRKAAWMEGGKWGEEAVAAAKAGSGLRALGPVGKRVQEFKLLSKQTKPVDSDSLQSR